MFDYFLFIASAVLAVGGALFVVFERNLMHACIFLLFSLIGVSGLYLTLNADFVAATQLVVYVGGVVILMLFAIMLTGGTNEKERGLDRLKTGLELIPLMGNMKTYIAGGITAVVFLCVIISTFKKLFQVRHLQNKLPAYESTVEQIGVKLLTDHIFVFEISSVLLLGALIGAAIIARPKRS